MDGVPDVTDGVSGVTNGVGSVTDRVYSVIGGVSGIREALLLLQLAIDYDTIAMISSNATPADSLEVYAHDAVYTNQVCGWS